MTCRISSIVSFAVFEKYVINIYDIVWRLKLDDPEYSYKGFEDCAFAYYVAFYLTPEIRHRYAYQLAPCTMAMKNRLLALPNHTDVKALLEMEKLSQQSEVRPISTDEQPRKIAEVHHMECEMYVY